MKIKYRIWDNQENKYFQPTYRAYEGELEDLSISMSGDILRRNTEHCCEHESRFPNRYETELYSGLKDKNGTEIYEGDKILIKVPYRSTQTHEGDNIPNGSYTEPMEPEIDEFEATVEFKEGAFIINDFESKVWNDNSEILLKWVYGAEYSEEAIKEAIRIKSRNTDSFDFWDDPKDNSGDLQYLLGVYEPNNLFELIEYLRGVEVIGNIHENPELLIKD